MVHILFKEFFILFILHPSLMTEMRDLESNSYTSTEFRNYKHIKKAIHGSNYYLMIYGDCCASKVQTGAACGNEVALWKQNVVRRWEHRLLTTSRICRECARASTRVSILALTAGCLPKLWMLEHVKLLQWLRNTDQIHSQPVTT